MLYTMQNLVPREACRVILYDQDNRVLLAKRQRGGMAAGAWSLIGGKLDPGETPLQAVIRETLEEVGLETAPQYLMERCVDDLATNERWRTRYYVAPAIGRLSVDAAEHSEAAFFDQSQIQGLEVAFDHHEIISHWYQTHCFKAAG